MGIRSLNNSLATYLDVFSKTGTDAVTPAPGGSGIEASGGVISEYTDPGPGKIYRAHIFTGSGTFQASENGGAYGNNVEYLIVAGGGGGGNNNSPGHGGNGGGGGGGLVEGDALPITVGTPYTITVGGGGFGGAANPGDAASYRNGNPSTISAPGHTTLTAKGGGGGGLDSGNTVGKGPTVGSGGGIAGSDPDNNSTGSPAGQPGTNSVYGATDYGNAGGTGSVPAPYAAGGGGGAGGAGSPNPSSSESGDGGAGRANVYAYGPANPVTYAGGGGGGNAGPGAGGGGGGTPGDGGTGGGGPNPLGVGGLVATGGGGGGVRGTNSQPSENAAGGAGIVVLRYQIAQLTNPYAKASGGVVSTYNGKVIHTFYQSGTFTVNPGFNEIR